VTFLWVGGNPQEIGNNVMKMNIALPPIAETLGTTVLSTATSWLPEPKSRNQAERKVIRPSTGAPEQPEAPWYDDPSALRGL
jgi:hypothetical protein